MIKEKKKELVNEAKASQLQQLRDSGIVISYLAGLQIYGLNQITMD